MTLRAALPHVLTTGRAALGAAALASALDGRLIRAATFITLSAVLDGVDGRVARWLGATSVFGALFDCFADYLCFIVAPWALTRALLSADVPAWQHVVLGLPLLTGAARYARNGQLVVGHAAEKQDLPGLGTVFFAFLSVTAVFLDAPSRVGAPFSTVLTTMIVLFSVMMVAPVPYPKLTRFPGASTSVLLLLTLMPFAGTTFLAATALILGLLYVVAAPFAARTTG